MGLTKISGDVIQSGTEITVNTIQVGSATTIHTTGIDLGSGNLTSHNINSTGIITATGVTVNGDLNVTGVLTYDDVTNIDSVGIITAQSGIHVTDGKVGIGTNIITDNSVFVELVADSSQVPRLQFDNKPAEETNNGEVGGILFRNNTDSVGYILCKRESAADDGYLQFGTQATGGGITERLRIDSNGRVSINDNTRSASDANEGAQLRVTGTPITRNQYYSPAGDYFGSFGYTDNTYTKSWIAVDSSYNQASSVSSGIFLSAFHSDANGSACGHTIKNVRTDAGGLIFSSVHAASSTGNPAAETERLRVTSAGRVGINTTTPDDTFEVYDGGILAPSRRTISSVVRYGTGIQYRDTSGNQRPILHIQAYGRGLGTNSRGSSSVYVNGVVVRTTGRSWGLTVISGGGSNLGQVLHSQTYDVYVNTSDATSMINDMATYDTNNNILIVNTYDEPTNNAGTIRSTLKGSYYAKHAENSTHRYAYVHAWRNGYGLLGECHSATRSGSTFTNQGNNGMANAGISFTVIL